jgi:plastocyanin
MKRSISIFVLLISFLVIGSIVLVYGESITKSIQVTYKNITIKVNGKLTASEQEPFIYQGRTFVPLRTIGEAFNKKVDWDNQNNQVIITDIQDPPVKTTQSISIKSFAFDPAEVTIKAGTMVVWTNFDSVPHSIKSDLFTSPLISNGETFSFTFTKPGTFAYICGVHPSMKGTIIVN